MKIAAVQMDAGITTAEDREAALLQSLREAAAKGADLVVFPELAVTGYGAGAAIANGAQSAELALASWQAAVDDRGVALALGLAIATPAGAINAAALLRPRTEPTVYAKRMLWGTYEKQLFVPGHASSAIVEIAGVRCGLLVCFDVEFPELCRDLALRGAELILVPVRAFENQVFVVYANHCGSDARFAYEGRSVIAAPNGLALAHADEHSPVILTADIDPGAYVESRTNNPYLGELQVAAKRLHPREMQPKS